MQLFTIIFTVCVHEIALALRYEDFPRKRHSMVGGEPASIISFPYQAAVLINGGEYMESGAIIGKKFVLTATFMLRFFDDLTVRVGSSSYLHGGQLLKVANFTIHERFNGVYSYDVVLLTLSEEIKYSELVKPVRMMSDVAKNGTVAVISGFAGSDANLNGSDQMLTGRHVIVDNVTCQEIYPKIKFDESLACAGNLTVCGCTFDNGDPLVQGNQLVGNFIGGSFCCDDKKPQLYNAVYNIRNWVIGLVRSHGASLDENIGHYYGE